MVTLVSDGEDLWCTLLEHIRTLLGLFPLTANWRGARGQAEGSIESHFFWRNFRECLCLFCSPTGPKFRLDSGLSAGSGAGGVFYRQTLDFIPACRKVMELFFKQLHNHLKMTEFFIRNHGRKSWKIFRIMFEIHYFLLNLQSQIPGVIGLKPW